MELIFAVIAGDTNLVEARLVNLRDDVNYIGKSWTKPSNFFSYGPTERYVGCTALSAAVSMGDLDMVKLLLTHGAEIDLLTIMPPSYPTYIDDEPESVISNRRQMDFKIACLLVRHCPAFSLKSKRKDGRLIDDIFRYSNNCDERGSLFLLRSIADNNTNNIELLIKEGVYHPTLASMKAFLDVAPIDLKFFDKINKGIKYATEMKHISSKIGRELKKLVDKKLDYKITLEAFPIELHPFLLKPSSSTLPELFARFRAMFLPEERLPSIPVDSASFNYDDHIDKAFYADEIRNQDAKTAEKTIKKIIRRLQRPMELNKLLEFDHVSCLVRLSACAEEAGVNDAALLLAEMLLFHHDADLTRKSKPVIFLCKEKQRTCLNLLTKLYSLTDTEKMLLTHHQKQQQQLNRLEENNLILSKQIESVSQQNEKIIAMLDAVLNEKASKKNDSRQSPYSPSFHSVPLKPQ
jgi:hypothetical protein